MLLDGVQDYAIYLLDPQGKVVSWNVGAERIKGYKAEGDYRPQLFLLLSPGRYPAGLAGRRYSG